ncbi:Peptidyl-prolyl cis-trans isomerase CWC27-like [Stylophora pistillata]|uniref:Spliceosome-associated protein CWC27 homolog n=1 Tax=Stylophora pistillata TaxID=50429 RepID=A0A2B4SJV2_STYPI|nr:Peptidyl-prolyl cis-trans isomerase CWC27-like [Stylophora pistillata]
MARGFEHFKTTTNCQNIRSFRIIVVSQQVLLITSSGEIEIELWSKEAPKTCRNFVQLCLEGYYDDTIFHRIIKGFCVQGGDPTGTGMGGESIYGKPFKDEFHQRLRFVRRGLVAMANAGPNDNQSQFFFTLGATQELNGKHTIFGKVAGDTIYNMIKMEDCEVNSDDRPLFPPKIKKTEVLYNPFDDIVPRQIKEEVQTKPEERKKKKVKGTKNFSLLSFGEEAEEDESTVASVSKTLKMKSSHDLLNDPKLSKQPAVENISSVKKKENSKTKGSDDVSDEEYQTNCTPTPPLTQQQSSDDKPSDGRDFDADMRDKVRDKLMKRKAEEDEDDNDKIKTKEGLNPSLMSPSNLFPSFLIETKESDVLAAFHAEQKTYLEKKKTSQKRKGEGRDEQTLSLLASFASKLHEAEGEQEIEEKGEKEIEKDEENQDDDAGWMFHTLMCEAESKRARDAYIENEDTYEIFDPRNPINKRRREASKKAMKEKRRRNFFRA